MNDTLLKSMIDRLQPGQKFYVQALDVDYKKVKEPIQCTFISTFQSRYPTLLVNVGNPDEVSFMHVSTDVVHGVESVTLVGVGSRDAEESYLYPAKMLSDEWAGALLVVLD